MRVLKQISTGKIISWMTNATPSTLTSNELTIPANDLVESDIPTPQLRSEWKIQREADDTYADKRRIEYPSINDLIVALWEGVVEERMASVTALEALRQAVKDKYPK
jgi:hypothetical protein